MTLDEAIKHCEEVAKSKTKQVENGDWEKGSSTERDCIACASEHQQLAEWLKELKAYKDARAEINQTLYDDARGEQNDYERGRKSGIFLCESIISVKLGESSSEIPNTCGDAISRQSAIFLASDLKQDLPDDERIADMVMAHNEGILEYQTQLSLLPSVSPRQRTGRWIGAEVLDKIREEIHATAEMHEDGDYYLRDEWIDEIIDKYKAESEEKE